ncbi:MAG: hypothetical protein LUD18_12300 [Lachnospiraceae bacterium]|nr:hypothetical protein [Lachnospiraceae bacterium]
MISEQTPCLWEQRVLWDAETAVKIVKLGLPAAIQSAALQFSFLFVSHMAIPWAYL